MNVISMVSSDAKEEYKQQVRIQTDRIEKKPPPS
jgi:hypothetical protein